jgi:DNA repair protein RadA/Sms
MRITEPALDLAVITALISSYKNIALDNKTILFGEVGLTGEIRAVNMAEQRVVEASKMGFEVCILPQANKDHIKAPGMKLIGVRSIQEVMGMLMR